MELKMFHICCSMAICKSDVLLFSAVKTDTKSSLVVTSCTENQEERKKKTFLFLIEMLYITSAILAASETQIDSKPCSKRLSLLSATPPTALKEVEPGLAPDVRGNQQEECRRDWIYPHIRVLFPHRSWPWVEFVPVGRYEFTQPLSRMWHKINF